MERGGFTGGYDYRLESLRGLAALSVAMFHIGQSTALFSDGTVAQLAFSPAAFDAGPAWLNYGYHFLTNGQGAVVLFFVLSGHVLFQSLEREPRVDCRTALRFLLRRIIRIYPPYIAMVVLCLIVYLTTGFYIPGASPSDFEAARMIEQMLLYRSSINGVAWTLQVELLGAVVVLVGWLAFRAWGIKALILVFLILFAISFTKKANWLVELIMVTPFPYIHFLYAFVSGMLISSWSQLLKLMHLPRLILALYPLVGLGLICTSPELFGVHSKFRVLGEVLGASALITGIVLNLSGPISRALDTGLLKFFGRISYSFYLLHPLALIVAWNQPELLGHLVSMGFPPALLATLLFVLSVLFVTPVAALSHRFVELPSMRAMKSLASGRPLSVSQNLA